MNIFNYISLMIMGFCILLGIRNILIFEIRKKHIETMAEKAKQSINKDINANWSMYFDKFDDISYEIMLFDLTKWTYKQFYGNFFKEIDHV